MEREEKRQGEERRGEECTASLTGADLEMHRLERRQPIMDESEVSLDVRTLLPARFK